MEYDSGPDPLGVCIVWVLCILGVAWALARLLLL